MKIAVGTLIQWYESEIAPLYIQSLVDALEYYNQYSSSADDITLHFTIYTGTHLEQPCEQSTEHHADQIKRHLSQLNQFCDVQVSTTYSLYTIADYRRDFNDTFCEKADVLFWGETDMLFPKQGFTLINSLHQMASVSTAKYIATFGICKMWDQSWKPLEHVDFTDKPFIPNDTENWWSLKYNMTLSEMNEINSRNLGQSGDNASVQIVTPHKFNGCGLIISSEVIKAGVNIPRSVFFVHEDTAFMNIMQRVMPDIPQYHFSNVLMVHNRKHPLKRVGVDGEHGIAPCDVGAKRKVHQWYDVANRYCELNAYSINNPTAKSYTWQDVFNQIKNNN